MFSTCNTYALLELPSLLSEANVWRLYENFPQHQIIIDTFWKRKRVINFDEILSRDTEIIFKIIEKCSNLKEVIFTKSQNIARISKKVLDVIVTRYPALEILDISGIPLSNRDLSSMDSFVSLKSLSINCDLITQIKNPLDKIFIKNQQLENLSIRALRRGAITFKNLSNSIKKIKIETNSSRQLGDLFEHVQKWRLEELSLPNAFLSRNRIIHLTNVTTLKNLTIFTTAQSDYIAPLLHNNPNLESVYMDISKGSSLLFLRNLPTNIKHLTLSSELSVDVLILIACAHTWNLKSLFLHEFTPNIGYRLAELIAAVPTLENLSLNCLRADVQLQSIEQLTELKSLQLLNLNSQFSTGLTKIMRSCRKLETLKLENVNSLLSQNLLTAIGNLPALKEIVLKQCNTKVKYQNFIKRLTRRNTLTKARFENCNGFNAKDALTLIRGTQNLTNLWIESSVITVEIVEHVVKELEEQKTRRDALYLTLKLKNLRQDMTSHDLHHKLELTTYCSDCINNNHNHIYSNSLRLTHRHQTD